MKYVIELTRTNNPCGPDNPGGQHTNGSPPFWYRINNSEWKMLDHMIQNTSTLRTKLNLEKALVELLSNNHE